MSVKHVNIYYKKICDQYNEMLNDIKELEDEVEKGLVDPEFIDRLRDQVAPIKLNYERWTYMMYLLHQPNRKSKIKKYQNQNQKLIKQLSVQNSIDATIEENNTAREHIGE